MGDVALYPDDFNKWKFLDLNEGDVSPKFIIEWMMRVHKLDVDTVLMDGMIVWARYG